MIFDDDRTEYDIDDRPTRVPHRPLLLRTRDIAGVMLVAVCALLTVLLLMVAL
jgi:hypothetical protein